MNNTNNNHTDEVTAALDVAKAVADTNDSSMENLSNAFRSFATERRKLVETVNVLRGLIKRLRSDNKYLRIQIGTFASDARKMYRFIQEAGLQDECGLKFSKAHKSFYDSDCPASCICDPDKNPSHKRDMADLFNSKMDLERKLVARK